MKRIFYIICMLLAYASQFQAQSAIGVQKHEIVENVSVSGVGIERHGSYLTIRMTVGLSELSVDPNRAVLLTPRLINGSQSIDLPSIGIYGRQRYYYYVRQGESMITGKEELSYRASQKLDSIAYVQVVPYVAWMDGALLMLHRSDYGCCNSILAEQEGELQRYKDAVLYIPTLVYVQPRAEAVKSRSLSGSAFVNFPVNKTVINPAYMNNTVELGKITATIDSVKADSDISITSVSIKGYASPEGSYANNDRLAKGRTEALRVYVSGLYNFPKHFVKTSHEPENWEGLRDFVSASDLEHKEQILSIIDASLDADARELKIRSAYPDDYRFLLHNCYPHLRRSDYRVEYVIRHFSDPEEIKRIMQKQPQKLSLEEFYLAAQSMEAGSNEYDETFEIAVRMYPDDPTANLNAANSAMKRNDLQNAKRYLQKAGQTPQAIYARAVLAALQGDDKQAVLLFRQAARNGIVEAEGELEKLGVGMK